MAALTSAATPSSVAASPGAAVPPRRRRPPPPLPLASMSLTTTRAPSAANRRASAAPMPLPAPVTTTPAPATVSMGPLLHDPADSYAHTADTNLQDHEPPGACRRQVDQLSQRGPVPVRGAQRHRPALGPLQQQVRRVLPGEADPAVHLHALLRGVHGHVAAGRLGQRDRDRRVRVAIGQAGGRVPGRGPGLGHRHPQVGQPVLERLERADRPGELPPLLQVGDGHLQAPLGHPELLGGEHRPPRRPAPTRPRPAAAAPLATSRPGASSKARSHSGRVASSDTTAARLTPGSPASTAYRPNGTPSPGTSSTSASERVGHPGHRRRSAGPARPGRRAAAAAYPHPAGAAAAPGTRAGGIRANPTASAAVTSPRGQPG